MATTFVRKWFPVLLKEENGLSTFFLKGILLASTHPRSIATLSVANKVSCYNAHASEMVERAVRGLQRMSDADLEQVLKITKAQLDDVRAARSCDSKTVFRAFVSFLRDEPRSSERNSALASLMLISEERGFASLTDEKRESTRLCCMQAEGATCKRIQSILHLMENEHLVEVIKMLKEAARREQRRIDELQQRQEYEELEAFLERELPPPVLLGADEPGFSF